MGKGSMRGMFLMCLPSRNGILSSPFLSLSENMLFLRHCHSQPVGTVQKATKSNSVKIKGKIYILKSNDVEERAAKQIKVVLKPKRNHTLKKKEKEPLSILEPNKVNGSKTLVHSLESKDISEHSQSDLNSSSIFKQSICKQSIYSSTKPFMTKCVETMECSGGRGIPGALGAEDSHHQKEPVTQKTSLVMEETKKLDDDSSSFSGGNHSESSHSIHTNTPDIQGQLHLQTGKSLSETNFFLGETEKCNNISSKFSMNNHTEPISENKILSSQEPEPHILTNQAEESKTSPKPVEEKGFFKSLWSMWK